MPTPEYNDPGFLDGMEDLLGMDENAAKELLARMDVESLTALTDAVTNKDKDAAEKIVGSFDTDEDVNPLFRGSEIEPEEEEESEKPPPQLKRAGNDHQFSFGDSVYIMNRDEHGKKKFIGATVYKPIGPHKTVGIKIDGKPKMINYNRIFVEEGVLGMVGVPNLQRIQQLAGMQPGMQPAMPNDPGVQVEQTDVPDSAAQQAMSALEALEQALPNVRLADLKAIRQRIINIQTCMNEGQMRAKKVE